MKTKAPLMQGPGPGQFKSRLDFGAIVFAPYVLTLAWQYSWLIHNQAVAGTLAVIIAAAVWYLYVATDEPKEKLPRAFWLLIALPLFIFYALRVAVPDTSFDVMNYHLMHSERALRGRMFIPGDFFPTQFPFNPAPDILTGFYRRLLGYRLGTLSNYLALTWLGAVLYRLLRDFLPGSLLRCVAVFAILLTEQLLFQVNNYMIDLLALPLMIEATRLAIKPVREGEEAERAMRLAFLIGASSALKLPNLIFSMPVVLVFLVNLLTAAGLAGVRKRILTNWKLFAGGILAFVLPFSSFAFYLYKVTGSPVFPLYNAVFKSPYWPASNIFDPRWGPYGLREILLWPVTSFFAPERISEIPVYSGRIALGSILALVCLVMPRADRRIRALCFIFLAGAFLWSATSGYVRYALYLEVIGGIILVWLAGHIWKLSGSLRPAQRWAIQIPLCCLLLTPTVWAAKYAIHFEWSMRPLAVSDFNANLKESKQLLRDRSLLSYLSPTDRAMLEDVEVWAETTFKTTAFEVLLKPKLPILGLRTTEHFTSRQARQHFAQTLKDLQGKRVFTLTNSGELENLRQVLRNTGFTAGEPRPISIPFFSASVKFDMLLVEVLPLWQTDTAKSRAPVRDQPLPFIAFEAGLSVSQGVSRLRPGETFVVRVRLTNQSSVSWPGTQPQWKYQLTVGNVWITERGVKLTEFQARALLSKDLAPGESAELPLTLTAPSQPGNYTLELDAVQEGVAWFGDMGSQVLDLKIRVE